MGPAAGVSEAEGTTGDAEAVAEVSAGLAGTTPSGPGVVEIEVGTSGAVTLSAGAEGGTAAGAGTGTFSTGAGVRAEVETGSPSDWAGCLTAACSFGEAAAGSVCGLAGAKAFCFSAALSAGTAGALLSWANAGSNTALKANARATELNKLER
ncbi:hypothetical protein [Labrys miyagiensis]